MRSHIFVHRATTKYFSNSFVFKTEIEKEGLLGDITPALGAGGPRFKSGRPDHLIPMHSPFEPHHGISLESGMDRYSPHRVSPRR
jgi:hypothetical protein